MNTKEATVAMVLSGVLRHPDLLPEHALLSGAHDGILTEWNRDIQDGPLRGPRISVLDWIVKRRAVIKGEQA
ncbi:MAG: hypothetical protein HZB35_10255 [Nitrospirae bacterium]|nr:hypothetical protein [Nitrospirota bacterium]